MKINQISENILSTVKYIIYFNYTQNYYAVDSFLELVRDLRPDYPGISEEEELEAAAQQVKQQVILAELASNFVQEYEFHSILAGTSELTLKPTATNPLIKLVSSAEYNGETTHLERLVVTTQTWAEFMANLPKLAQGVQAGVADSPTEYVLVLPVTEDNLEIFFQMLNLVGVLVIHDLTKPRPGVS